MNIKQESKMDIKQDFKSLYIAYIKNAVKRSLFYSLIINNYYENEVFLPRSTRRHDPRRLQQ